MTVAAISISQPSVANDRRIRTHRDIVCGLVAATIWGGYLAFSHYAVAAGLRSAMLIDTKRWDQKHFER